MESSISTWRSVIGLVDGRTITLGGGLERREAFRRAEDYAAKLANPVEYYSACLERVSVARNGLNCSVQNVRVIDS